MITLDGYTLEKQLNGRGDSETFLARRGADGQRVVLKQYADSSGAIGERQHRLLTSVDARHAVRALDLDQSVQPPVLVLDYVPGKSLAEAPPLDVPRFLEVGIALAKTLSIFHAARILHNDITPHHVLVPEGGAEAVLIGFRSAAKLGDVEALHRHGDIRYAGPEHSSRTSLSIDFRSDLYALGSTLYHAITGSPPFADQDRLALIHAHIARPPVPPVEHSSQIPATISRILMKLLSKDPTHRYQTASALEIDLEECRRQLAEFGQIEDELPLATADAPVRPMFARRLVGREKESQKLLDAWQLGAERDADFYVVTGGPGYGKSALIDVLRTELVRSAGYLARGKFEEQRADHPYFGVVQALSGVVDQILAEGADKLEVWRGRFLAELGNLARVVVAVIPDLEAIVGETPAVPALAPDEERERFALAVVRFVRTFASGEHALVIALEDMHWADGPSLHLTSSLLRVFRRSPQVLLIGTWRDVDEAHRERLDAFERRLADGDLAVSRIAVGPLDLDGASAMLRDALRCDADRARELAAVVLKKTGGSPFLIQQFIHLAHDRGHVQYRYPDGWIWDGDAIEASGVSDDAVQIMIEKLGRLDPRAVGLIQLASCVGMECDVDLLVTLSGEPRERVEEDLFALNETGLIAPGPGGFRFTHDRIREAAQALVGDRERSSHRCRIAQVLMHTADPAAREKRIFEIADHLRATIALVSADDRVNALESLALAARKALDACAPKLAHSYVASALEVFEPADWTARRALCLGLFAAKASAELRLGHPREALDTLEGLECRDLQPLERAPLATQKIEIALATDGPRTAVEVALKEVRKVGLSWPLSPSRLRVWWASYQMERDMAGDISRMFEHATQVDLRELAQLMIMASAGPAAAQAGSPVGVLTLSLAIRIYTRRGYLGSPAFALAAFALRCAIRRRAEEAKKFADLALETARGSDPRLALRARFNVHVLVRPLYSPRANALASLPALAREAEELGSVEYQGYTTLFDACYRALNGERLRRLLRQIEAVKPGKSRSDLEPLRIAVEIALAPRDEIAARAEPLLVLPRPVWSDNDTLPWTFAAWVAVARGELELAREALERAHLLRAPSHGKPDVLLVDALFAGSAFSAGKGRPRTLRRRIRAALRSLESFAHDGPDFVHMADLARAELARAREQTPRALSLFERAAARAAECGFVHHAALAHERRAEVLLRARRGTEAEVCLQQAVQAYSEWGAKAKARELLDRIGPNA